MDEDGKINEGEIENDFSLKNVYEDEIFEVIKELEDVSNSSSDYLTNISNDFVTKNKCFTEEIKNHIKNQALKYNNLFKLDNTSNENKDNNNNSIFNLKIITKKTIKLIRKIIVIHSQIFSSLKHNLKIMFNFFNITKYLNSAKPIQDYLSDKFDDIVNCWLFMKVDFEKFDFNKALSKSKFDSNFKNSLSNICKYKNINLNIIYPKSLDKNSNEGKKQMEKMHKENKKLFENEANLMKLRIENVDSLDKIIDDKLEFLKIKKLYLKNTSTQNKTLFKKMPNLENLTLKYCPTISINLLSSLPEKLKKLSLEKNNFLDTDFTNILSNFLIPNKYILNNLETLSFANNNITMVNLSLIPSRYIFNSLTELNFSKNRIYKFIYNKEIFRKLKFINCCNNNLNKSYLSSFDKIIGLEGGNCFLLDSQLSDNYFSQLKTKLISNEKNQYIMSYLNITYIPKIKSINYFNDFNINENIMIHLRKLDLSYNKLNCDTLFKFIGQNRGFINLRCLKLNGNNLDDSFFEKYLEYGDIFIKLEKLYLNMNNIGDNSIKINYKDEVPINEKISKGNKELVYKLRLIYLFIQKNINLTKLTLTRNPISEMYYIKNEKKNDADKSKDYIERDNNNHIIINCFYSLLVKIRDELLSKEDEKVKRSNFNIRFDCCSNINNDSANYDFSKLPLIYRK